MNPLWVDARDYLVSQGQQVTPHGLNAAMNLLASNPQLRPSAVKAGGGAAGIAAGLGAPTDQIVQTPLAPPASQGIAATPLPPPVVNGATPRAEQTGKGKQGASSGNKKTPGGTPASKPVAKTVPGGVGNYAAAGGQGDKNSNTYGVTPPAGYSPASPASTPVGTAQAGAGASDPGFLSHLFNGDYNDRLAAAGGGLAAVLGAVLLGRGGKGGRAADAGGISGDRIYGPGTRSPGDVLGPQIPHSSAYPQPDVPNPANVLTEDHGAGYQGTAPSEPYVGDPRPMATPGGTIPMPDQSGVPPAFEQMLAQLAAQAPQGAPGGRAIAPPVARPPIAMPNATSGPTINMPPTGGQQLMDILRGLGARQ